MLKCNAAQRRTLFAAILVATAFIGLPDRNLRWRPSGVCALVANPGDPCEKILQCGQRLTVHPAHGTSYRPIYKTGRQLPAAIRS